MVWNKIGFQDVRYEAKLACRTSGVKHAGLQDVWCEARRTSGVKQKWLPGHVV